jgi:hypothetical protein
MDGVTRRANRATEGSRDVCMGESEIVKIWLILAHFPSPLRQSHFSASGKMEPPWFELWP